MERKEALANKSIQGTKMTTKFEEKLLSRPPVLLTL